MKTIEKQKAIALRKSGMSIKAIANNINVSKSSVSLWVRNVALTKSQISKLSKNGFTSIAIEKRRQKRLYNESIKKQTVMSLAGNNIKKISKQELRIIGLCLYWGEGGKTFRGVVRIANSDPAIIKIMMRFFREIYHVEESKFRGHIHTYSHLNVSISKKYWSSVSGIPEKQFYKPYVKRSIAGQGKRETLPYGTFDIYICDTNLFLTIIGQIEKMKTLLCKTRGSRDRVGS